MFNSERIQDFRKWAGTFIVGGDWADNLPRDDRRNLVSLWFDGLFSAASDTVPLNYLSLYLLALGATSSQIGLFSALTSLAAAICLLPGAMLVERFGHRKEITVWFGGGIARIALLVLALLPFGLKGQALIWVVILMAVIRSAAGNLAFPGWMSIIGDIVPLQNRGRYFGSRNLAMVIAGLIITYLMGEFITWAGSPQGYQLSLILAFAVGMVSTYYFSTIRDQQAAQPIPSDSRVSMLGIWKDLRSSPLFISFCLASAVWNFSVNVAAPFFNVYMVQNLNFTAAMVGITAVATSVTKIFVQKKIGELSDRWGSGKVQLVSMIFIPILPLAWLFVTQLWHVVAINILGGVLWGAFELVSFNFLLQLTPDDLRARYSAIFQIIVTISLAGGAIIGSSIILWWGYNGIFVVSAVGRLLAAVYFLKLIRDLGRINPAGEPGGASSEAVDTAIEIPV